MISVDTADLQILDCVQTAASERLPIDRVTGRILREIVSAERDAPPFDRVMMDGFAIRYREPFPEVFTVRGIALAGHEAPAVGGDESCIEVTTGCPLPPGSDTIVPIEDCLIDGELMSLREGVSIRLGQHIHGKGSDGLAGRKVLIEETRLGPPELAILATEGRKEVAVGKVPRIGLITTGDEVVLDGNPCGAVQIRGSHYEALQSLFSFLPGIEMERMHARDDEDEMRAKLEWILDNSDIVLITGGVSRGRKDLVPHLLRDLGVEEILHRVAQRPGKPMWFGNKGNKLIFGLPGNPISTLICARRYVIPAIERWMGCDPQSPIQISLSGKVAPLEGMTRFVPVRIRQSTAFADPYTTSGSLHDLAKTDGFVEMPPSGSHAQTYKFFSWSSL